MNAATGASAVPWPRVAAVLMASLALFVVPQALRAWIDPALSTIAVMIVDALAFARLVRPAAMLRTVAALLLLAALVAWLRRSSIVAAPSVLLDLTLALGFGISLRAGQVPLIVRIVRAASPRELEAPMQRYLRGVTAAWALFFVAMAAGSVLLALLAPFAAWSFFVNVLFWPLIGAMFVGEYLARRAFFPQLPRDTPWQAIRSTLAYFGPAPR